MASLTCHAVAGAKWFRLKRIVRPLKPAVLAERKSLQTSDVTRERITKRRHNGFELCRSLGEGLSEKLLGESTCSDPRTNSSAV